MENFTYLPPVDQLLTYGDCLELQRKKKKPDYVTELQLTAEQIPELIRMATDPKLLWADSWHSLRLDLKSAFADFGNAAARIAQAVG